MIFPGHKYGKLTAVKLTGRTLRNGHKTWYFDCDCGEKMIERDQYLVNRGTTRSCGCLKTESHAHQKRNLVGKRFSLLLVKSWGGMVKGKYQGNATWLCVCDCGVEKIIREANLIHNRSHSCGCLLNKARTKHGLAHTNFIRKYRSFCQAQEILKIPHPWKTLERFQKDTYGLYLQAGGDKAKRLVLMRIDPLKPFSATNVSWTTGRNLPYEVTMAGGQNSRSTTTFTYKGKTLPLSGWARVLSVSRQRIDQVKNEGRLESYIEQKLKLQS